MLKILSACEVWACGWHPKTHFPTWPFGLDNILLKWKINAWLNLQHIFCDTKVYYWVDFLDLFSKVGFRKAWHCSTVIFLLPNQTCGWIVLLLSTARFPWYFTPRLFGETELGIEVAVCKDKSLEARTENGADLWTEYCILRLADLSAVSAKADLTCEANAFMCYRHNFLLCNCLNCKDTPLPALTFSQFPFAFVFPGPSGLIYSFLIGRVGERWKRVYSRIVYSRCPMMNHPSCLSTSPKVSH